MQVMSSLSTSSGHDAQTPGSEPKPGTPTPRATTTAVQPLPARTPFRTFIRWLPVIATIILAAFTVVQAFGKMHKRPTEPPAEQPTSTVDADSDEPSAPRQ